MAIIRFYRKPGLSPGATAVKLKHLIEIVPELRVLETEICFNVEVATSLDKYQIEMLRWILASPFHMEDLSPNPHLNSAQGGFLFEIGPRLNFSTAFSTNAVSICKAVGLSQVSRLEASLRYLIVSSSRLNPVLEEKLVSALHDRMTQCRYMKPIESFDLGIMPQPWFEVDIMSKGRKALEEVNSELGLAFDNWDLDFYTEMFQKKLQRNPTSVECFDLAQSNSEHSRHWFFKGKMIIDGEEQKESLIDMIINTQNTSNPNNVIKFSDNSSAIIGCDVELLRPKKAGAPCPFQLKTLKEHLIFTAETHNFPTGVAPFSGATTGTGGRIRDVHAVGRGGHYIAGTAGYCVGNLFIPGYTIPGEILMEYPSNFAKPLEVLIEASNGASDYGNKFGEPVVSGFSRSFGMILPSGERREWIKPIMFSGGVGSLDATMVNKLPPEKGMRLVKIGGPVYRIGVGGGSASSVEVQGDNKSELDFGAVQRGDAEMEQKLHRVIRACLELDEANPICSIHDQGAGGNGNVLKELVEPCGAVVFTKRFQLGDPTLNTLEIWGAEYQENDALLCNSQDVKLLSDIAARERCPINFVGVVTGSGKIVLSEEENPDEEKWLSETHPKNTKHPVDLDLELVLGKMPNKVFHLNHIIGINESFSLKGIRPKIDIKCRLEEVFKLPSVGSKRFLTTKVDRCVTGLVAQQQCVGPLHQPLADVAVVALSQFTTEGIASAIGEQPIKGLVNAAAGARMTVAESLTNLVFAPISKIKDIKCSGNWMWAAKLPGEGAALYTACQAMCNLMGELGIAVDGGKDSLSMAARVSGKTVKAPGTLVVSTYAPCIDVRKVITPDLKGPRLGLSTVLLLVDLSGGKVRSGGTALAQSCGTLGDTVPDVDNPQLLAEAFNTTQKLIKNDKILSGHDISDGGIITCLLEMAFGGHCGLLIDYYFKSIEHVFSEELGWILEVEEKNLRVVENQFSALKVPVPIETIGWPTKLGPKSEIIIRAPEGQLHATWLDLFMAWEETSHQLELLQANPECAMAEHNSWKTRKGPQYKVSFDPSTVPQPSAPLSSNAPVVAVIREEGINGDREMAASLHMAHFEVWDVTMQDLLDGKISVDYFRGVIFPGGFSYADTLGSAKGWAASLLFHPSLRKQFQAFVDRPDTFSLGVCNGCQLMCLLGWVGPSSTGSASGADDLPNPPITLGHNNSERFECRFSTVHIFKSPSLMLKGMEGSTLGVWVAHGEGKFEFRNEDAFQYMEQNACLPLKYVDDNGKPTMNYPLNPNGSRDGVAAVCSEDGRHLAMMPHPERCTVLWQWPWLPSSWGGKETIPCNPKDPSPWLRMFQNAYVWAVDNPRA